MRGPADVPIAALRPSRAEPLIVEDGGTSTVEQVEYVGHPYLFKRYHDEYRAVASPGELTRLIGWPASRPPADRRMIAAVAAWPRHAVWDGPDLLGMLIRPAADAFLRQRRPRSLDMMPDPGDGRPGAGLGTLAIRLNAFGNLLGAIMWFHDRGVVINDLHAHNVLVSRFGDAVHLVDCDSMVGQHWQPVLPGNVAPDGMREVIPEVDDPSTATDFARLAHVIISLLANEDMFEIGEPTVAQLAEMLGDPVARFLCSALRVATSGPDSTRMWRLLEASWSAVSVPAGGAEAVPPRPSGELPFRPLLPPGYTFPDLDVSSIRPLLAPGRAAVERQRGTGRGLRSFLARRFGAR